MAILDLVEWVSDGLVACAVIGAVCRVGWVVGTGGAVPRLVPAPVRAARR